MKMFEIIKKGKNKKTEPYNNVGKTNPLSTEPHVNLALNTFK